MGGNMALMNAAKMLLAVVLDLLPIAGILAAFQGLVLRRMPRHPQKIILGLGLLIAGLVMVLAGLEGLVFPLGQEVAGSLALATAGGSLGTWALLFGFLAVLGFAAALAEPVLTTVAHRAQQLSGGTINPWGLRVAVAVGIGLGACLGLLRMIMAWPLFYLLIVLFLLLYVQARFTPKILVNLALDSGVATISTVTAPLLVAVGIGVASQLAGASAMDGFGLLIVTAIGPAISLMAYAQLAAWRAKQTEED